AGADGESPDGRGRPAARRAACPPRRSRARGPRDRGAPVNGTGSDLMARAVALGEHGRRSAPPNPWVGCVVVDEHGEIAGEGWHRRPGTPHAEADALASAGERARRGTAYVTLEPCAHHGRTPPCADALVSAGVRRVVVALEDPDPRVAGRGLAGLRAAGVEVELGPGAEAARRSLAPYLHHRRTGRARCLMQIAMTPGGRRPTARRGGARRRPHAAPPTASGPTRRRSSWAQALRSPIPRRSRLATSTHPSSASPCGSCSTGAGASRRQDHCSTPRSRPRS